MSDRACENQGRRFCAASTWAWQCDTAVLSAKSGGLEAASDLIVPLRKAQRKASLERRYFTLMPFPSSVQSLSAHA